MVQRWVRFSANGGVGFGTLTDDVIHVYSGDMFANPRPTGAHHALLDIKLLAPTVPSKVVAL